MLKLFGRWVGYAVGWGNISSMVTIACEEGPSAPFWWVVVSPLDLVFRVGDYEGACLLLACGYERGINEAQFLFGCLLKTMDPVRVFFFSSLSTFLSSSFFFMLGDWDVFYISKGVCGS